MNAIGARQEADLNSAIAMQNAENQQRMADDAQRRGSDSAYSAIRNGRQTVARQLLAMAANNVDSGSGSLSSLIADTSANAVYDALIAQNNADREAYGYLVNAANSRTKANVAKAKGRSGVTKSLLTGAIGVGNSWWKYYGGPQGKTDLWNSFVDREW